MGSNPTAFVVAQTRSESRFFDGPAGRLDARIAGEPDGRTVLLLHPHPKHGGTMGSRLVYDLWKGLAEAGFLAVRFDYRGVGRSEGEYGDGDGETEDALAVLDALAEGPDGEDEADRDEADEAGRADNRPVVIGHSFGAGVAARVATRRDLAHLIMIGTPSRIRDSSLAPIEDAPGVPCGADVIVGTEDQLVSMDDAEELAKALPRCVELRVLEGADHFLGPEHTDRVLQLVLRILD